MTEEQFERLIKSLDNIGEALWGLNGEEAGETAVNISAIVDYLYRLAYPDKAAEDDRRERRRG